MSTASGKTAVKRILILRSEFVKSIREDHFHHKREGGFIRERLNFWLVGP